MTPRSASRVAVWLRATAKASAVGGGVPSAGRTAGSAPRVGRVLVALALATGLLYGVSDFLAALAARRAAVLLVTAGTYLFAALALGLGLLVVPGAWTPAAVLAGLGAGVSALVGFAAFYAALAAGPISLLSPLIALLQSAVPVAIAFGLGERLSGAGWSGVALAVLAALLLGVQRRTGPQPVERRALVLAVVAGVGLGLSIVALDAAPGGSGLAPVLIEVLSGLLLLTVVLLVLVLHPGATVEVGWLDGPRPPGPAAPPWARTALLAATAGLVLGVANALLMLALHDGELSVVAVLVGLYPLATIVLARVVLRERLSPVQGVGIVLALSACGLLAAS